MARIRRTETAAQKRETWYIALYIRLSRDDGYDESLSVTNQKKILTEYVKDYFLEDFQITDCYIDDGMTGTDYDRPDFQRMIHDVETGKVNCIICKNLSRAFRNYSDQGYFLEKIFPLYHIRFIALGDPKVDTYLNPESVTGLEVPINGLMNDRFAYKTSSDVRRTFDTKRRNGEFIGAFAPYGYKKHPQEKNRLIIDDEAAWVVKSIFQWFIYGDGSTAEGLSKEGIAKKLNDMGIPNPSMYKLKKGYKYRNPNAEKNDGLWQGTSVSRILKNRVYTGTMVQGRQKVISYKVHDVINVPEEEWYQVENTHEEIISQKLFDKARQLQKKDTRAAPGKRENYLFAGLLKCADCKKSMTRRSSGGYVYYNCSTYKRKSKDRCTKHTIRLDVLEKAVLHAIQTQIRVMGSVERIADTIRHAPASDKKTTRLEGIKKLREQELHKIEGLISGLYMDWKNGDITREQYRSMRDRFQQQEIQLRDAVDYIKEEIGKEEREGASENPYLDAFLENKNIVSLTQGILTELVESIDIHEGGGITIHFKFKDPCKRAVGLFEHKQMAPPVPQEQPELPALQVQQVQSVQREPQEPPEPME